MINLDINLLLQENTLKETYKFRNKIYECDYYRNALDFIMSIDNFSLETQINMFRKSYKYKNDENYDISKDIEEYKEFILINAMDFISEQYSNFSSINNVSFESNMTIDFERVDFNKHELLFDENDIQETIISCYEYIYRLMEHFTIQIERYPELIRKILLYSIQNIVDNYSIELFSYNTNDIYSLQKSTKITVLFYSILLYIIEEELSEQTKEGYFDEAVQTSSLSFVTKKTNTKILGFVDKFANTNSELSYINSVIPKLEKEIERAEDALREYKSIPIKDREKEAAKLNTLANIIKGIGFITQAMTGVNFIIIDSTKITPAQMIKDSETNIRKGKQVLRYMYKRKKLLDNKIKKDKLIDKVFNKGGK